MHETGLVQSLLRQVSELANRQGASCVQEIEIEIGVLAGVEPLLVESAFARLVQGGDSFEKNNPAARLDLRSARLMMRSVPLGGVCRDCHREFNLPNLDLLCPSCGSRALRLTRGEAFRLLSITLNDAPQTAESPL